MPSDVSAKGHGGAIFWSHLVRKVKLLAIRIYLIPLAILTCILYLYLFADLPLGYRPVPSLAVFEQQEVSHLLPADDEKQRAVVSAFKHAWKAYEHDAMGYDEYHPLTRRGSNLGDSDGVGYTVLDAIDTMVLMNLNAEYSRAHHWVKEKLRFDRDGTFSTFETTIRVLGGLLSAYNLTSDGLFLEKAIELGDRLLPAFQSPSGIPFPSINLGLRKGVADEWSPYITSTAEATTLQLEFKYLAHLTGNAEYWYKVEDVMAIVERNPYFHHLVPIHMDMNQGTFIESEIRLGSRGDSYYEYLLKQYLQTNGTESVYRKMYDLSMQGLHDKLVMKTVPRNLTFIAELLPLGGSWKISPKQDHLVCFLAGSLMLGATTVGRAPGFTGVSIPPRSEQLSPIGQRDWTTGVELLETCMETHNSWTGLSPEIVQFRTEPHKFEKDWFIKGSRRGGPAGYDARYMLRPETVESLFIAWRLTGDIKYRNYAWSIFTSIEHYARIPRGGYATVLDVDTVPVILDDKQETFFLAETLKYLYLIFSDGDLIPLDRYVFNTEAHPLPIFQPSIKPKFG